MSRFRDFRLYSGSSNPDLASRVAEELGTELGEMQRGTFADGERKVHLARTVRGIDVFLFQSTSRPVNDHIMELLLMIDAAQRASAGRITAVLPYMAYGRQDRKDQPRVPISARLLADMIEVAGADRVLTMHMHADQIQGFFDIPMDHLYSTPLVVDHLSDKLPDDESVIVSPDAGAANRSRALAKRLDFDLAIIDKRRPGPNRARVANIIGEVEDKNAIILDDMIDTGGTLTRAARAIHEAGARSVMAVATHPIFSSPAIERIEESALEEVIVCDTIQLNDEAQACDKVTLLPSTSMWTHAIECIHEEKSIKDLFV